MVGKSVLIGLTYQDEQGRTLEHKQLHGRIVSVNERDGFRINLDGLSNGQSYRLPPDPALFGTQRPVNTACGRLVKSWSIPILCVTGPFRKESPLRLPNKRLN